MSSYFQRSQDCWRFALARFRNPVRFALATAIALTASLSHAQLTGADTQMTNRSGLPMSPDTGTPEGHTQPGTRRPEATCQETEVPLTALVANNGSDFTISEYPTFLFYIPFQSEDIRFMEFLLLDEGERQTVYRTAVGLEDDPGVIQVTLPEEPDYALREGENYRWYFKLDCLPARSEAPDLVVDGWVRYVGEAAVPEGVAGAEVGDYRVYEECEFWYDAISSLAGLYFAETDNRELAGDWTELLESLGHGSLADMPLANSTLLPVED